MSIWSAEVGALFEPAETFREVIAGPAGGAWAWLRRPLFLLFAMGMLLSLHSSGRLSIRAVADGMVSFAFLPVCEVISIGVVYLSGDRRVPFARVVDAFFVSNAPWLLWILGYAIVRVTQTPVQAAAPPAMTYMLTAASLLVPLCWSAYLDLHFFRVVLSPTSRRGMADLLVQRGIAWAFGLSYFFGIVAWAQLVEWVQ